MPTTPSSASDPDAGAAPVASDQPASQDQSGVPVPDLPDHVEPAPLPEPPDAPTVPNNRPLIATVVASMGVLAGLVIPILGLAAGVVAIMVSRSPRNPAGGRNRRRGLAKAGFVIGVIAVVLSVLTVMARITQMSQGA